MSSFSNKNWAVIEAWIGFLPIKSFWGEDQRYKYCLILNVSLFAFFIWRFAKNFRHLLMTLGENYFNQVRGIFIWALERRIKNLVIFNFSHRKISPFVLSLDCLGISPTLSF
jgi:hypothetical protein